MTQLEQPLFGSRSIDALVDFLDERIKELDEAAHSCLKVGEVGPPRTFPAHLGAVLDTELALLEHLQPERLLAECDARRRILDRYRSWHAMAERDMPGEACFANDHDRYADGADSALAMALHDMALPYSLHKDFRPEWLPL